LAFSAVSALVLLAALIFRRGKRLTRSLVCMLLLIWGWQIYETVVTVFPEFGDPASMKNYRLAFMALISMALLLFTLRFYGIERYDNMTTYLLLGLIPAMTVVVSLTGDPYHLVYSADGRWHIWFWIQMFYVAAMLEISVIVTLRQLRRIPKFYRTASWLLLLSLLLAQIGGITTIAMLPFAEVILAQAAACFCGISFFFAARTNYGLDFLNQARNEIFNELEDAIFILDGDGTIIGRNTAAKYLIFKAGLDQDEHDFSLVLREAFGLEELEQPESYKGNGPEYEVTAA
jgi:hypothetical protein